MARVIVWVALAAVGAAGGCRRNADATAGDPREAPSVPIAEAALPSGRRAPPAHPMRDKINEAIAHANVASASEVDAYLDSLAARARAQGKVTALEVQPGVAVIRRYWPGDETRVMAFSQRMLALQHDLTAAAPKSGPVAGLPPSAH